MFTAAENAERLCCWPLTVLAKEPVSAEKQGGRKLEGYLLAFNVELTRGELFVKTPTNTNIGAGTSRI
jgi:hypothetical protein